MQMKENKKMIFKQMSIELFSSKFAYMDGMSSYRLNQSQDWEIRSFDDHTSGNRGWQGSVLGHSLGPIKTFTW